jgi:hypothetical protein
MKTKHIKILLLTVVLLSCLDGFAQTSESDKLRNIEESRLKALVDNDISIAASLHADNFELINPLGETSSKEKYLGGLANGEMDYKVFEPISEIRIRISGNQAVLRYKSNIEITFRGTEFLMKEHWHTDLYEKIEGEWKIVWSQATIIN